MKIEKDIQEEFLRISLDKAKNVLLQGLLTERLLDLEEDLHEYMVTSKYKNGSAVKAFRGYFSLVLLIALFVLCCIGLAFSVMMLKWGWVFWKEKEYFPAVCSLVFLSGPIVCIYGAVMSIPLFINKLKGISDRALFWQKTYPNAWLIHEAVEEEIRQLWILTEVTRSSLKQIYRSRLLTFRRDLPDVWFFELNLQKEIRRFRLLKRLESNIEKYPKARLSYYMRLYRQYEQFAKIAFLYESVSSGRCELLEGDEGAYQLLGQEENEKKIMQDMRKLIADPEQYKVSRPVLYREYLDVMETLQKIMTSNDELMVKMGKMNLSEEMSEEQEERLADEFERLMEQSAFMEYVHQRGHEELKEKNRLYQLKLLDIKLPKEFESIIRETCNEELASSHGEIRETGEQKFRQANNIGAFIWSVMFAEAILMQLKYSSWIAQLVHTDGTFWILALIGLNLFYVFMIAGFLIIRNQLASKFGNQDIGLLEYTWMIDLIILLIHTWACFSYLPANILP